MRRTALVAWLGLCVATPAFAIEPEPKEPELEAPPKPAPKRERARRTKHGPVLSAIFYVPNRLFDLTDLVRFRLRVGPGFAADARVTQAFEIFIGRYDTIWVGIPGPRGRAKLPLPIGFERQAGFELGPANTKVGLAPAHYGKLEVGAGAHVFALGLDVGVDPWELYDFLFGLALRDPGRDDF